MEDSFLVNNYDEFIFNKKEKRVSKIKNNIPTTVIIRLVSDISSYKDIYMKTYGYYSINHIFEASCNKFKIDPSSYMMTYDNELLDYKLIIADIDDIDHFSVFKISIRI